MIWREKFFLMLFILGAVSFFSPNNITQASYWATLIVLFVGAMGFSYTNDREGK